MALRIRKKLFHHIFCSHPVVETLLREKKIAEFHISVIFTAQSESIYLDSIVFLNLLHNQSFWFRWAFGIVDVKTKLTSLMVGFFVPTCSSCLVDVPKNTCWNYHNESDLRRKSHLVETRHKRTNIAFSFSSNYRLVFL